MTAQDLYQIFLEFPTVSTDTRNIKKDCLFFALKGPSFNGNKFALQAIKNGASYAIVDEETEKSDRIIQVDDVLKCLQSLAQHHRKQFDIPVIAITGTNGKTTSKELIRETLASKYEVLATEGNLNNHIGVPLTLLKLNEKHQIAIIEMGANHPGEIADLCKIALPNYGLITNVGTAHLEGFLSFDNIVETKTDLYRWLEKNKGTAFVRKEHSILLENIKGEKIEYSTGDKNCFVYGNGKTKNNRLLIHLQKAKQEINIKIHSQLIGTYNTENILAAITIALFFDVSIEKIIKAIENYQPSNNRSQLLETKKNTLILDAYNANPSSLELAIDNFLNLKGKDKTFIIGSMLELGEASLVEHKKIIKLLSQQKNPCFFIGKEFINAAQNTNANHLSFYQTSKDFISSKLLDRIKNNLILLKGSRGIKLETLIPYL